MFQIVDLASGYVDLVKGIVDEGHDVTVRGLSTRELTDVLVFVPDVADAIMLPLGTGRRVNCRLAAVEALSLISGVSRHDLLVRASPAYESVLVDAGNPDYGAYGPRTVDALRHVVQLLVDDPTTRRAVVAIWRAEDLTHDGDRPCTLTLQFRVRDGRLDLTTSMRSQDVWLGVPYDYFMFTQLQLSVAYHLGLYPGSYAHYANSLHLYDHDVDHVDRLQSICASPVTPDGVQVPPERSGDNFWDCAYALLTDDADVATRAANPWYATQLDKLYEEN
jgi:thymidylate synthase